MEGNLEAVSRSSLELEPVNIALFLPRGWSLDHWERVGLFDYSVGMYKELSRRGYGVTIVSYGDSSEARYVDRLDGIVIAYNRWGLSIPRYEKLLPWIHWRKLRHVDLVKSYQVDAAEAALRAAEIHRKPFVARCGYLLSDFVERGGFGTERVLKARATEERTFTRADRVVVTTEWMRKFVIDRYFLPLDHVSVIPNYVDTKLFAPDKNVIVPGRIIFVGRLEQQKNVLLLLEACRDLDVSLLIIGTGSQRAELESRAKQLGVRMTLLGVVSHQDLAKLLQTSMLFVLPTSYEGHPKAIMEAMSCGLPVIAGDVVGVNDLIEHGKTGWLCATDTESVRESILHLLGNDQLRGHLGDAARSAIVNRFAFEGVVALERAMIQQVVSHP
jgi:glycosyltransferase involved in cell wall biosynthesis